MSFPRLSPSTSSSLFSDSFPSSSFIQLLLLTLLPLLLLFLLISPAIVFFFFVSFESMQHPSTCEMTVLLPAVPCNTSNSYVEG